MRTFQAVERLPVISKSSGKEYGRIIDVLLGEEQVIGFVVDQAGWLNKHLFLPTSSVRSFGVDGVMIEGAQSLRGYSKPRKETTAFKGGRARLQGLPLLTKEGTKLGLIEDVYFQEEMGTIVGYEVTEGLVADLLEGRKIVKSQQRPVVGGGRAILTD